MISLIADIDDALILIIESVSMSHGTTPKVISNYTYSINDDGNNVLFQYLHTTCKYIGWAFTPTSKSQK